MTYFQKAFASARKEQGAGGRFEFGGKQYNTNYADDAVQNKVNDENKNETDYGGIAKGIGDILGGSGGVNVAANLQDIDTSTRDMMVARRKALMDILGGV